MEDLLKPTDLLKEKLTYVKECVYHRIAGKEKESTGFYEKILGQV